MDKNSVMIQDLLYLSDFLFVFKTKIKSFAVSPFKDCSTLTMRGIMHFYYYINYKISGFLHQRKGALFPWVLKEIKVESKSHS